MFNPINEILNKPSKIIEILIDNNLKDVIFSIKINKKADLEYVAQMIKKILEQSKTIKMQLSTMENRTEWVIRTLLFLQSELDIQIKICEQEGK